MEKIFQRSLMVLIKPTKEQRKLLLEKMKFSNNFRNQLIYMLRQTEHNLNERLREKYTEEREQIDGEIKEIGVEMLEKIDLIKNEIKKKGCSNNKKIRLSKEIEETKKDFAKKKKKIWDMWKQFTKKDRKVFYTKNKIYQWKELSKIIAIKPKSSICSEFFNNKSIDRNNIDGIGIQSICNQIGKKEAESFKSVIATRSKRKKASLPKYHKDKKLKLKDSKGYSSLIICSREYDIIKNKLYIYFDGKKEPFIVDIKKNKYFPEENFDENKPSLIKKFKKKDFKEEITDVAPYVKYQRLEIIYDKDKNKFYGIISIDQCQEIDENYGQNKCVIDLGQKNMFTYIIANSNGKIIGDGQIKTKEEYSKLRHTKHYLARLQSKIDLANNNDSKKRHLHPEWKKYKLTNKKITNIAKTLINKNLNNLYNIFIMNNIRNYYIGNLKNMKVNKKTNIWLRSYINQRMKDKNELHNIQEEKVSEFRTSHTCPICRANPWMKNIREKLKIEIKKMKKEFNIKKVKIEHIKRLFRNHKQGIFHCPCCNFKADSDYVGVVGISLLNNLIPKEEVINFIQSRKLS